MIGEYKLNEIYNEDSYEAIKKIPDKSVDCIYTDIPYLIDDGGCSGSELSQRIKRVQKEEIEYIRKGIDYSIFDEFVRIMKKGNIFIWCSKRQIVDILNYFNTKLGWTFEILVWCKTNPTPMTNNVWLPDVEYCLYFRQTGVRYNEGYFNKSKYYVSAKNKDDKDLYKHPTIKPLELVKRHLLHTTKENDIVADFFLGSGTTCVAAKELNRRYIGFEIDKEYYKIAKNRLNGITASGQMSIFTDFEEEQLTIGSD